MPPPPLRVPCCPRPPVLNNCNDLSIFKSPSNYHTVSFSPFATLAQIAQFFRINLSPLPAYSFYQDVTKPCLCILQQPSPQICGARIADHFINDTLFSHVDLGQVACLWHGCDFMVPHQMVEHTDLARMLLTQHILIDHFKAIPVCPLCRCDMRQPPPLPRIQGHTYTVKEHIGSGWCIGLARIALAQGLPVMVPQ
ncbi:hypothetical protein BD626DRAFT_478765 [Schizophyllum amplum]|uniref:Uncharacterized protein n=1 Tax=Schizophyllum amplum TaxID=97359 RepID=A0A550CRM7_9AGAR|nr:hypothetical protein BD626DRAFT_478765 [Auriculariopsis ampla]